MNALTLEAVTELHKKIVDKAGIALYTNQVGCLTADFGSLAQLGEHLPYKQRVIGSSPITSTPVTDRIWRDSSAG